MDAGDFVRAEELAAALYTLDMSGVPFDLLLSPQKNQCLVVGLNAAIGSRAFEEVRFPVFSGLNLLKDLPVDFALINDSTLYLAPVRVGWYVGTTDFDLPSAMTTVVEAIVRARGYDRVVFFGVSGGGNAALRQASRHPGSVALACNPQIDIARYHRKLREALATECFGMPMADIPAALKADRQFDIARHAGELKAGNDIIYLQDSEDSHHYHLHAAEFLDAYGAEPRPHEREVVKRVGERLLYAAAPWAGGHGPPPKPLLADIVTRLASGRRMPDILAEVAERISREAFDTAPAVS